VCSDGCFSGYKAAADWIWPLTSNYRRS
jgi:hypothetical protein